MKRSEFMDVRHHGLRPNPHTLGVTPLARGEVSKPVRIRADSAVHAWLATLTPAQLGQMLTDAYQSRRESLRKA